MLGLGMVLVLVVGASIIPWPSEQPYAAADVQISIEQLGSYIDEWSEPEGYFDSDNFISNETSYLHVIDDLRTRVRPGGIYLGVGPDQNFSYIAHTRPALAVITDIRRQNMLQHLFFKALFDKASNRAEYLALLFSKEKPAVAVDSTLPEIVEAVRKSPASDALFRDNLAAVKNTLLQKYRLQLMPDDLDKIEAVYQTFHKEGLDLRFSSIGRNNGLRYPTLEQMILETDSSGNYQSYLSSDDLFQWVKKFQAENRLVPIVGDFAGSHALRSVAAFLKANGLRVSTFYTSNVEFYLFGTGTWTRYAGNIRAFPLSDDAVFIRSYFPTYGRVHPFNVAGHRSTSLIQSIGRFLEEYDARTLRSYWDVVKP